MKGFVVKAAPLALLLLLAPIAHAQQPGAAAAQPCLSRSQITAGTTPVVMMTALPRCVQEGRMQDAVDLYNIAGVFAYFDRQRVADETAHSAYDAMKMSVASAMDDDAQGRFNAALRAQLTPDKAPAYIAGICSFGKRMGPPTYAPSYMLAHGMSAFTGRNAGLVPGFVPAQGWQATLERYLKCPA